MNRRNIPVVALFGLSMIGGQDCWWSNSGGEGSNGSSGSSGWVLPANVCPTDPPVLCYARCIITPSIPGMPLPPPTPMISMYCDSGGVLAAQFVDDVTNIFECDPDLYGASYAVFPTYFSLTPTVTQTGNCTVPPSLPPTLPLADAPGFNQ